MDGGTNVVQFVPRADVDAQENLAEFVRIAREALTAFGAGGAWERDRWQQGKAVVVFATKTKPLGTYAFTPMADPFRQFAKAYVRYEYGHRPVVSIGVWIQALRCIEAALLQVHGRAEVGLLNLAVMDVGATKCREFYGSEDVWCQTGRMMARIFDFCREHRLVRSLPSWQSPFPKPKILTEDLGEAGKAHREAKLPSNASMLALADLFCHADDRESQFFSSIMVLLMVAPGRISEVLRLPVDCIGYEPDNQGEPQMYLRWWAAKGKGFTRKWIVPAMRDVVSEAVRRLTEIGAPARVAAKFAFDHLGQFLPYAGCPSDISNPRTRSLTVEEFCTAMGIKPTGEASYADGTPRWGAVESNAKWIARWLGDGPVTYAKLTEDVRRLYCGRLWPFIDEQRTVNVWDALCLHREHAFRRRASPRPFSWRLPRTTEVNDRLGTRNGLSLFKRYGLKNPDGSSIKLTSHQLRHWLSTMSERAGMDDYMLAQWAGRARVADNRHYDHRTPEERLGQVRALLETKKPSLLVRFANRQPVTYEELGIDRAGAAKPTLYGLCVHDYSMTPCTKLRQCMVCSQHVCIKGDFVTLDRIRRLEAQLQVALDRAGGAWQEGAFGADRWVDHFKWELAHTRTMRIMLERPEIPDGTPLRIPSDHDPSPVQRAMMNLGVLDGPGSDRAALPVAIKPLPGAEGA